MTPVQLRMARAGLGWSVADVATASSLSPKTVQRFESRGLGKAETIERFQKALDEAGARFICCDGYVGVDVPEPAIEGRP